MKSAEIISLWKKREYEKLETAYRTANRDILTADPNYILYEKYKIDTAGNFEHDVFIPTMFPEFDKKLVCKETDKKLQENYKIWGSNESKVDEITKELTALCSACETWEQEKEILIAYGILNEKGVFEQRE